MISILIFIIQKYHFYVLHRIPMKNILFNWEKNVDNIHLNGLITTFYYILSITNVKTYYFFFTSLKYAKTSNLTLMINCLGILSPKCHYEIVGN